MRFKHDIDAASVTGRINKIYPRTIQVYFYTVLSTMALCDSPE